MKIYKIIFIFLVLIILLYGTIRLFQPNLLGLKTDNIEQNTLSDENLTYGGIKPVPSQIELDLSIKNIPKNLPPRDILKNFPTGNIQKDIPRQKIPSLTESDIKEMAKKIPTLDNSKLPKINYPNIDSDNFKTITVPTTVAPLILP